MSNTKPSNTKPSTKAKGISLHIGLNRVDPAHYQGWSGDLQGCENDANDLAAIAKGAGFTASLLLTEAGTTAAVQRGIGAAASQLEADDFFLLTYSGHGGQVPDASADEADRTDETWVLYDRQLVDDELYEMWSQFAPGVRILVLSDSCHSGTAIREEPGGVTNPHAPRTMPKAQALAVYEANKALYDAIERTVPSVGTAEVGAHVLLLSGCQDDQTSADGARNGLFTQTLLGVWDGGHYTGGYKKFYNDVVAKMPPWQQPNWMTVGPPSAGFQRRKPFTI
jgi:hypothetical protein